MTKEKFEFHAPHQDALHHASQDTPNGSTSTNQIAMFTAVVATVGALFRDGLKNPFARVLPGH